MKAFTKFATKVVCLLGLLVAVTSATAQVPFFRDTFGGGSQDVISGGNFTTTNYWYIVPARGNGLDPRIQWISYRNDKAGGFLSFYTPGTNQAMNVISNAISGTNVFYASPTNTLPAAGNKLVIQYNGFIPERYQELQVVSVSGTSLTVNSNLTYALSIGDTIWKCSNLAARVPASNATNNISNSAGEIFAGRANQPILIELDSTTVAGIDAVSGVYGK